MRKPVCGLWGLIKAENARKLHQVTILQLGVLGNSAGFGHRDEIELRQPCS
jgi:hypothetical protein